LIIEKKNSKFLRVAAGDRPLTTFWRAMT